MQTETSVHSAWGAPRPSVSLSVAVLGLGYVGLPVALACAESGFQVFGVDSNPQRLRDLREGKSEEGTRFRVATALRTGSLSLSEDPELLSQADVVFFCVPTPAEEAEAVHAAVRACARDFARHGRADALVILESTVRPGFARELLPLLGHGGRVALAYAPERIDPQRTDQGLALQKIPRLVAGVSRDAQARAAAVLRQVGIAVHPVELEVAEYAKLLENSYRLLNIAFIDQLAALCRADGVDVREVIRAAATKPFGFQPFWPGVGAGGHCIGVDPAFLTHKGRSSGVPIPLLEGALQANGRRPKAVAEAIAAHTQPGDTVLVVGLTYKPGVPDTRESAAVAAARVLSGMDRRVLVFDELVGAPDGLTPVGLADGLRAAEVAVLLVKQTDAVHAALEASGLPLLDATGVLPGAQEI